MSADLLPGAPAAASTAPPPPDRRGLHPAFRLLGTPIAIAITLLLLYLWVKSQTLDFNEKQTVNWPFIRERLKEHISISLKATVLVVLIAVPAGILVSRRWFRLGAPFVLLLANLGQAVPVFGLLILLAIIFEPGTKVALIGLVATALLPVLRNTVVGIQQVDPALIEAGRGMGMTRLQVLMRIELPLAVPAILAAIRTTMVLCVGMATVVSIINGGGLGEIIFPGIKLQRTPVIMTGGILALCLAYSVDWLGAVAEYTFNPFNRRDI